MVICVFFVLVYWFVLGCYWSLWCCVIYGEVLGGDRLIFFFGVVWWFGFFDCGCLFLEYDCVCVV